MEDELPNEWLVRPLGEILKEIGVSISEAQGAMDNYSILTQKIIESAIKNGDLEFAIEAPWQRFSEVEVELKMAISISTLAEKDEKNKVRGFRPLIMASPLNASYINKSGFNIEGASKIRAKIVPVPPSRGTD